MPEVFVLAGLRGEDSFVELCRRAQLRALLSARGVGTPFRTYQALAKALGLVPPGTTQRIAAALEEKMREDVLAEGPMVAALVVSRTDRPARRSFFDLAVALGRFPADPEHQRAVWKAECTAYAAVVKNDYRGGA